MVTSTRTDRVCGDKVVIFGQLIVKLLVAALVLILVGVKPIVSDGSRLILVLDVSGRVVSMVVAAKTGNGKKSVKITPLVSPEGISKLNRYVTTSPGT